MLETKKLRGPANCKIQDFRDRNLENPWEISDFPGKIQGKVRDWQYGVTRLYLHFSWCFSKCFWKNYQVQIFHLRFSRQFSTFFDLISESKIFHKKSSPTNPGVQNTASAKFFTLKFLNTSERPRLHASSSSAPLFPTSPCVARRARLFSSFLFFFLSFFGYLLLCPAGSSLRAAGP